MKTFLKNFGLIFITVTAVTSILTLIIYLFGSSISIHQDDVVNTIKTLSNIHQQNQQTDKWSYVIHVVIVTGAILFFFNYEKSINYANKHNWISDERRLLILTNKKRVIRVISQVILFVAIMSVMSW